MWAKHLVKGYTCTCMHQARFEPGTSRMKAKSFYQYIIMQDGTTIKNLTRPSTISGPSSRSGMSLRKFRATESRASSGHSLNQSMVQQLTNDGNWRRRARKTSPMGLEREQIGLHYTIMFLVISVWWLGSLCLYTLCNINPLQIHLTTVLGLNELNSMWNLGVCIAHVVKTISNRYSQSNSFPFYSWPVKLTFTPCVKLRNGTSTSNKFIAVIES